MSNCKLLMPCSLQFGPNAINKVAYSEDTEVPAFVWRWFYTGDEIPQTYSYWADGEPLQGFDELHQTFSGCAVQLPTPDIGH
jgi:hypothetical protein